VSLGIQSGSIRCQLKLAVQSGQIKNVLLNRNFSDVVWKDDHGNVLHVRNIHRENEYKEYTLVFTDTTVKEVQVTYSGKFPVDSSFSKLPKTGDWKGNIAFNGKSCRASEQTVWYPVLLDRTTNQPNYKVTYDVHVSCQDCETIYLNGNLPVQGVQANLKSNTSVPLILFAGNFKVQKTKFNWYLNSSLSQDQLSAFDNWVTKIQEFFSANLSPYGKEIIFIETTPVSKNDDWAFVTFPTIVFINQNGGIGEFLSNASFKDSISVNFLAHELGHFYFGEKVNPSSALRWAYLEGFTSYLALKCLQKITSDKVYLRQLRTHVESAQKLHHPIPLKKVVSPSQLESNSLYRYDYIPILLTALEIEIGEETLWKAIRLILSTDRSVTDYTLLKNALISVGVTAQRIEGLETNYLDNRDSIDEIKRKLRLD
jgi:hypothetical protein